MRNELVRASELMRKAGGRQLASRASGHRERKCQDRQQKNRRDYYCHRLAYILQMLGKAVIVCQVEPKLVRSTSGWSCSLHWGVRHRRAN